MNTNEYRLMNKLEDKHFWFVGKRHFVDSVLTPYSKQINKVLDLGSGTGGMTKFLEKYGKVTGIEKDRLAVSLSKERNVNIKEGDIQKINFGDNKFDLITIFDVLYHKNISNIPNTLNKVYRALKPNGLILITDSAFNFLKSSHDLAVHGVRRFNLKEIEKLLIKCNFKVLKLTYTYFTLFPIIFIKRVLLGKLVKNNDSSDVFKIPVPINSLITKMLYTESMFLKHINFPVGSTILVLAQKI